MSCHTGREYKGDDQEDLEFKDASTELTATNVVDEEKGIVEAIVAVTGIEDKVHDVIEPGAFKSVLAQGKPKGAWAHDWKMIVAKTLEAKELMPGDPLLAKLAPKVAAMGGGGLYVKARYNLKSVAGRDAFETIKFFEDDQEWSIGYKVDPTVTRHRSGRRHIGGFRGLYEYSGVLTGAHPLTRTASVKSASWVEPEGLDDEDMTEHRELVGEEYTEELSDETKDVLEAMGYEAKAIRRVRTPEGARRYGVPVGTIINTRTGKPIKRVERRPKAAEKEKPKSSTDVAKGGGDAKAIRAALREEHPDWDSRRVATVAAKMEADAKTTSGQAPDSDVAASPDTGAPGGRSSVGGLADPAMEHDAWENYAGDPTGLAMGDYTEDEKAAIQRRSEEIDAAVNQAATAKDPKEREALREKLVAQVMSGTPSHRTPNEEEARATVDDAIRVAERPTPAPPTGLPPAVHAPGTTEAEITARGGEIGGADWPEIIGKRGIDLTTGKEGRFVSEPEAGPFGEDGTAMEFDDGTRRVLVPDESVGILPDNAIEHEEGQTLRAQGRKPAVAAEDATRERITATQKQVDEWRELAGASDAPLQGDMSDPNVVAQANIGLAISQASEIVTASFGDQPADRRRALLALQRSLDTLETAEDQATDSEVQDRIRKLRRAMNSYQTRLLSEEKALTPSETKDVDLKPGDKGSARGLIRWYEHGEGALRIRWGTPGDFNRCVRIAKDHMTKNQAEGFCNLRHKGALGKYPGDKNAHKDDSVDVEAINRRLAQWAELKANDLALSVAHELYLADPEPEVKLDEFGTVRQHEEEILQRPEAEDAPDGVCPECGGKVEEGICQSCGWAVPEEEKAMLTEADLLEMEALQFLAET